MRRFVVNLGTSDYDIVTPKEDRKKLYDLANTITVNSEYLFITDDRYEANEVLQKALKIMEKCYPENPDIKLFVNITDREEVEE